MTERTSQVKKIASTEPMSITLMMTWTESSHGTIDEQPTLKQNEQLKTITEATVTT